MNSDVYTETEVISDDSTFEMPRSANDVIAEALRQKARPPLFDAFWQGGEVALLFGEAGGGKSVLATQIAEALARGKPIDGFVMPKRRHKVLYVDLNLSAVQFQRRYTPENENGGKPSPYRFAERFHRGCPKFDEDLVSWVTRAVRLCGYEVVVIDDLSAVMRTDDGTFDSLRIMREMKRLSQRTGVSILVLADSMPNRRGLEATEADLRRSRILCSVADSVFGLSCLNNGLVKLIQFRTQTAKIVWDSKNAVECTIFQQENGFLGMYFDPRFQPKLDRDLCHKINFAAVFRSNGFSYNQIAHVMGISKSQAFRLVRRWTPSIQEEVERLESLKPKAQPEAEKEFASDNGVIDITPEDSYFEDAPDKTDLPWYQRIDPTQVPFAAGLGRRSIYDLESETDEYGNRLFVESRSENDNRRAVWYTVCKRSGHVRRHHRTMYGTQNYVISNSHWLPRRE